MVGPIKFSAFSHTFYRNYSSDALKVIEMSGQTIEDVTTICTVPMINAIDAGYGIELELEKPSCVIE